MIKTNSFKIPYINTLSTKKLFFVTLAVLIMLFGLYIYLVNKTIMNVVSRSETEKNISGLSSTIGTMEYKYISLKNSVTIELAHEKGFQDASPKTFISKTSGTGSLTFNSAR